MESEGGNVEATKRVLNIGAVSASDLETKTKELIQIGTSIASDVERLVRGVAPKVWMSYRVGAKVESQMVVLYFGVADLGGSDEQHIKTFIQDHLLEVLKEEKCGIKWGFEVDKKEKGEEKK